MAELKVPVTRNDHILGEEDAPVTLLEYGDYECPHCGRAHPIVKAVKKHFGDQLAYVFRHFPLTQMHPLAERAAETAEFAGSRQRFWQMHDGVFENQNRLGIPLFLELAEELALSSTELLQALESQQFAPIVREHFLGGVRSGVNGTPTFFINGQRHEGPYELEYLVAAIDEQVARAKPKRRRAG
jgi:protein-disulfide isomerase